MFFFKSHAENKAGKLVPDLFWFFQKSFIQGKRKQSPAWFHYILIAFKWAYNKNKLYKTLDYSSREIINFDFLRKGSGKSFSITFCDWFLNTNITHVIFYQLTKCLCLIALISWDIRQYVYCICLLTRLCRHKSRN